MEELAGELCPPLHSVFIKGCGSILIHADGTASFKVYHKSDVGSIQQSEDKLLEYLGVVIYEALDWGIDSQLERELSGPLEKLLCLMLKLDDEPIKPEVTLQDVIKVMVEQKHKDPKVDVAAPKPRRKLVGGLMLYLVIAKKEMLSTPSTALNSPSDSFLTLRDASTEFKVVNTKTQQLGPGVQLMNILSSDLQETTPELPDSACLSPSRSSLVSYNSTGLTANSLCPPFPPTPDVKPKSFLNTVQQQLPPYRRRSKSVETGLQSKELQDCLFPTKWPSPTIAELIGTRYSEMVLEGQDFLQRGSDGVFLRAKFLRLSREDDPATEEQKSSELLHEIEHGQYFGKRTIPKRPFDSSEWKRQTMCV
ncbi:hypothetical protein BTVI_61530 [Pitangus sulphuratus]|nr:hypothetical protein BTVI_61530 [Pitangus sulphuratus]